MLLYRMALSKTLRTSLVSLGLFAAAMAGHAQQQPQKIEQLVKAPVAQQAVQAPDFEKMATAFLKNPSDTQALATLTLQSKMTPQLTESSMIRVVGALKMHLSAKDQNTTLQSMLAAAHNDQAQANQLLQKVPEQNVVVATVKQMYENNKLFDVPTSWSEFNQAMWKVPTFNVQTTLSQPGVKTLQGILKNTCATPTTSVGVQEASYACAMRSGSTDTKNVTKSFSTAKSTDGLLVGEYEGIPVLVVHTSTGGPGTAAVYRIKDDKGNVNGSPFIAISLDLLNVLQKNPDTMAFIMEHELGHVEHNHRIEDGGTKTEVQADAVAIKNLMAKGMSMERIVNAYQALETKMAGYLPASISQETGFKDMMAARNKNVLDHVHSPAFTTRSMGFSD